MHTQNNTVQKVIQYLEKDSGVLFAVVIGSQARSVFAADKYSDIDIIMVAAEPKPYLASDDWLKSIGAFHISFIESTFLNGKARRILFDDSMDADFIILNAEQAKGMERHEIDELFARGYQVIKDKLGISNSLSEIKRSAEATSLISENNFRNLVNDFWFHSVWTAKKLMRGELFTAKYCLDVYMKGLLLALIETRARLNGCRNTWYLGRFLEKWSDKWTLDQLATAFARYDLSDMARVLMVNMNFFGSVAANISQKLNYAYPKEAEVQAYQIVRQLLAQEPLNRHTNNIS